MTNITKEAKFKLPRHRKDCAYRTSAGKDFCNCKAKFNGKPFAHWQRMAQKDVVEALVHAVAVANSNALYSLPSMLAEQQLWNLLSGYPDLVEEVLEERYRCIKGFNAIMEDICSGRGLPLFDPSAVGLPDNRPKP